MNDFPLDIVLAVTALLVSLMAFVWEFVLVGRKRLGYRVQMDTPVTGEIESVFPGVLPQLRPSDGSSAPDLQDLSVVLLRIENYGWTDIDSSDYAVPETDRVGVHVNFPRRRIIGMAVTELSDAALADSLRPGTGIGSREDAAHRVGILDLPKVPLNRRDHYKILAILQRTAGTTDYPDPAVHAKIKGGRITETSSRTGVSPKLLALIGFLVLVIGVQVVVALRTEEPKYVDCGSGKLTLVGSTAFAQAMGDAKGAYEKLCPAARISLEFEKSQSGVVRLNREGKDNPGLLAITDGPVIGGLPELIPRTLALSPYTMVVHPEVKLDDLTADDIRRLYQGSVSNWKELDGPDLPVRVVHRPTNSGTREMLHKRLLGDGPHNAPRPTVCYAITPATPGPAFCEADSTKDMLDTVADTPGAIGYSDFYDATRASGVRLIGVDRHRPDSAQVQSGIYPLWSVEYAYSYGVPAENTLAASFLRFLTRDRGADILRKYHAVPCSEIRTSNTCEPVRN